MYFYIFNIYAVIFLIFLPFLLSFCVIFFRGNTLGMRTELLFSSQFQLLFIFVAAAFLVYRGWPVISVVGEYYISHLFMSNLTFSLDTLNIWFLLLSLYTIHLCLIYISNEKFNEDFKLHASLLVLSSFSLVGFFLSTDLFYMYFFFEGTLMPMFIIIGAFGSRSRRIYAAYILFFYTFISSLFMLTAIMHIYECDMTTNIYLISNHPEFLQNESILFFFFCIAVAAKLPLYPLHIWLPEAHVEAPTTGSVILAALLLKMGGFIIVRVMAPIFPNEMIHYKPFLLILCLVSTIYASINAIRQIDMKKIIALSSIVHMGICAMALFTIDVNLMSPGIFLMVGHGVVSAGLFFCIGCLYDRIQTRDLHTIGSTFSIMPTLSFYFFIFMLGNIAFPGTVNFIAEFGIFKGLIEHDPFVTFCLMPSYIANAGFNIWLATRLLHGPVEKLEIVEYVEDVTPREHIILFILAFTMVALGTFLANPILTQINTGINLHNKLIVEPPFFPEELGFKKFNFLTKKIPLFKEGRLFTTIYLPKQPMEDTGLEMGYADDIQRFFRKIYYMFFDDPRTPEEKAADIKRDEEAAEAWRKIDENQADLKKEWYKMKREMREKQAMYEAYEQAQKAKEQSTPTSVTPNQDTTSQPKPAENESQE